MTRLTICLTAALGILLAPLAAHADDLDVALVALVSDWNDSELEVRVNTGLRDAFPVGDEIDLHFALQREGHLLALHRDSSGALTILSPGPLAPTLGDERTLSIEGLEVSEPLGGEAIFAIATAEPLDLPELQATDQPVTLQTEQALDFVRRLSAALAAQGPGSVGARRVDYETVSRDEIEFTVSEVYTGMMPTRSVPRPRMDFHGVRFAFDSAELTERARRNLDVIGEAVMRSGLDDERFQIGGHTDDVGSEAYNEELSLRRTESAKAYLVEHWKVPADRIETKGFGESRPAVEGDSEEARAQNRRVELEVIR